MTNKTIAIKPDVKEKFDTMFNRYRYETGMTRLDRNQFVSDLVDMIEKCADNKCECWRKKDE